MYFYVLLLLLLVQRLNEISIGNRNFNKNSHKLISPFDKREKQQMMMLHSLWFISCFTEYFWHGEMVGGIPFFIGILTLIASQYLRFLSMNLLGDGWTHFPVAFKDQTIVTTGPYRYVRHPNYLAVVVEIALVPLLGKCFWTAAVFTILNIIFLSRRIKIEEKALLDVPGYERLKMNKKLIPYLFSLLFIISPAFGGSIKMDSKSFDEAKKEATFFKFIGKSSKFGLLTTSFEGYATKGDLSYSENDGKMQNIVLDMSSKGLDTDNSSRNEKMWEKCLDTDKHPRILVTIKEILLNEGEQVVDGEMNVRGSTVPLKIAIKKVDEKSFTGTSSFKLSDAKIPDPSIAIASVKDKFDIEFRVRLP